jgi:ribonuclease HII
MPKIASSFDLEEMIRSKKHAPVIAGIDEVGRGAWAGCLVACAFVFLNKNLDILKHVKDSKKISPVKRNFLYNWFLEEQKQQNVNFAIGKVEVEEVNRLGLSKANDLAMLRSIDNLSKILGKKADFFIIDGLRKPDFFDQENCMMVPKGDSISHSIASASIVAKVFRDNIMKNLHAQYPFYGWDTNCGYGTKLHIEGIKKNGVNQYHRTSYKPIKKFADI